MLRVVVGAVVVVALGGRALGDPKPTIAIVVNGKDPESGKLAEAATAALRTEAAAKRSRYAGKPSPKDVAAAVLESECSAMQPACATAIGTALGVDYMLVGEAEQRGKRDILVVALVNVRTKQRVRSLRDTVIAPPDRARWLRSVYARLIDAATGELTLVANAQRGQVLVDGVESGALFEGRVNLSGIALGAHTIAIRAPGFKPFETEITVDGTTRENLLLEPL